MNSQAAKKFMESMYPSETVTMSFPASCRSRAYLHLCDNNMLLDKAKVEVTKVKLDITNNESKEVPIEMELIEMSTKEFLAEYASGKIHIDADRMKNLCMLQRAKAEAVVSPALDSIDGELADMYANYNWSKEEVDAALAAVVLDEEEYQHFLSKLSA